MMCIPNLYAGMLAVFILILSLCGSAFGNSLDRGAMQERYNGAAKDMLRVPGVVGSYEQDALSLLQQAGLSVKIKRITQDQPKYAGQEGQVIKQDPASGGMAMIGSLVTLTIYKKYAGVEGGYSDSAADSWGSSDSSSGSWGGSDATGESWGGSDPPADSWDGSDSAVDSWDGSDSAVDSWDGSEERSPSYDGGWPSDSSGGGWSPAVPESGEMPASAPTPIRAAPSVASVERDSQ